MFSCSNCSKQLYEISKLSDGRILYFCENCLLIIFDSFQEVVDDFDLEYDRHLVDDLVHKFQLSNKSFFLHVGSGSGQFLKYIKSKSVPCLGIEKNHELSGQALEKNVSTINGDFNVELGWDLLSLSNKYTHGKKFDFIFIRTEMENTDNLDEFIEAIALVLKEDGVCFVELDWVLDVMKKHNNRILGYKSRFLFSLHALRNVLDNHNLEITDIYKDEKFQRMQVVIRHKDLYSISPFVTEYFGQEIQSYCLDKQSIIDQIKQV